MIFSGDIIICENDYNAQSLRLIQRWGQGEKLGMGISWRSLETFKEILLEIVMYIVEKKY